MSETKYYSNGRTRAGPRAVPRTRLPAKHTHATRLHCNGLGAMLSGPPNHDLLLPQGMPMHEACKVNVTFTAWHARVRRAKVFHTVLEA